MGHSNYKEASAIVIPGGDTVIPRITKLIPLDDLMLRVTFDDGKSVLYDVKEDIKNIPSYKVLETETGLFKNVRLDPSRTCVYWSDEIDLPSDAIYEYGKQI